MKHLERAGKYMGCGDLARVHLGRVRVRVRARVRVRPRPRARGLVASVYP